MVSLAKRIVATGIQHNILTHFLHNPFYSPISRKLKTRRTRLNQQMGLRRKLIRQRNLRLRLLRQHSRPPRREETKPFDRPWSSFPRW